MHLGLLPPAPARLFLDLSLVFAYRALDLFYTRFDRSRGIAPSVQIYFFNNRPELYCRRCIYRSLGSRAGKGWRGEFTLKEAGEKCDVSGSALSRMENGDLPDLRSFIKLVDATGVDPEFALQLVRLQLPAAPEQPATEPGAAGGSSERKLTG